jgi:hypothetical protein
MRGISKYPVGATWEYTADTGKIGRIWLEERDQYLEMWKWSVVYSDGSGYEDEWYPSRRLCLRNIPLWNHDGKPIRFKRVK